MASSSERSAPSCARGCVLLSSTWAAQNPFLGPTKSPNILIRELQGSVASKADECFRFLHSLVSQNALLAKALSFSSIFAPIGCRNERGKGRWASNGGRELKFAAILPGDSVAGLVVANGLVNFLNIYNSLLVVRLLLTWFPNSPPAIVSPLSTLCDPYLNIFRGIIPPLGGTLDLSPILAFLVLNAFTSTAAALPAELPGTEVDRGTHLSHSSLINNLTTSQKKWMKRLCGSKSESSACTD